MKNDRLIDLGLTGYEELFMSTEERLDAKKPKVEAIPLADLTPFRNHPFKVKEDEEMAQLMTDAILNSKISLAKAKGIRVVADAHIPVKLKSSEIDLCCIIGNLFDNAIEASVKLPEDQRLIRVYMDMKNTQLYISFTNFTAGKKMQKEGKLFHSTKGDGHGFGLVRIDAIVERLEGYISRNSEDGAFTTEILLPQV